MSIDNSYIRRERKAGKLKIFLGMVAGVGKTYAMLESAKGLLSEGTDVVVGLLETHGRKKTEALTKDFEFIPRKKLPYSGTIIEEMDLDAILARRPDLVLVDELAHTNAPGSRHPKRYMDVEEILQAGIDVFSTINVQHFESRVDIVKNLSGVAIKESVPDSILDMADQIELIDLPPDELLARLTKGEIYPPEKIERSRQGFFKRGTLTALRELSLRLTAEKVDREVLQAVRNRDLPEKIKTRDRLLVAIGPSPSATELLRWTRNKAFNLEAPWIATYVDTGYVLSVEDRKLLDENIELAHHLGAEVVTVSNPNVAQALIELARERQVTEIVMGRPRMSLLHRLLAPESPVDRLYREKEHFTISIVTTEKMKVPSLWQLFRIRFKSQPGEYFFSFANVGVTTAILLVCLPIIGYRGVGLIYLFSVLYQALFTGRGPIYLSAFLSATAWNFFFIPPRYTFHVGEREDIIHLVLFLAMASVLGSITNKSRASEQAYREREKRATFLFEVSKVLSGKTTLTDVLKSLAELLQFTLNLEVSYYIRDKNLEYSFSPEGKVDMDSKEQSVALWAVHNERRAGHDTETLPRARGIYFPLCSESEVYGAMGFYPPAKLRIDFAQKSLLEAVARQLAVYFDKQSYFALKSKTRTLEESARLQKALFSSISHELKTPLTSIIGSAQALSDTRNTTRSPEEVSMLKDILSSGARLAHVVEQLLDMSRLESGKLIAKTEWVSLEEALGLELGRLESRFGARTLEVRGVDKLPLVRGDFGLTVDVIRNVLLNSLQYASADGKIEIQGIETEKNIILDIMDEGPGVSPEFQHQLFERFSRDQPGVPGGLGLGLSICQGFMDAMQGRIEAKNREDEKKGFLVRLTFVKEPSSALS